MANAERISQKWKRKTENRQKEQEPVDTAIAEAHKAADIQNLHNQMLQMQEELTLSLSVTVTIPIPLSLFRCCSH